MKFTSSRRIAAFAYSLLATLAVSAQTLAPHLAVNGHATQLIVDGKPYLVLAGELGNSSAGTAEQADTILPKLARMHLNTVLMPVAWEQIEPTEGAWDFSILDHWIEVARRENLHIVPLWFGSWKNAFSNYVPAWVKQDTTRFPRAIAAGGSPTEILSTFGSETLRLDQRAFAALMQHIEKTDGARHTVLMVQVENEVGYLGRGRDRSTAANQAFRAAVAAPLLDALRQRATTLSPELAPNFNPSGKNWQEVFGLKADETFMAWRYATYIQAVADAGKRVCKLPVYVNAQLPAPAERAGEYPSGGPHPYFLAIYRATAPALDFYSPDIYWPDFEYWINRYRFSGNAVFVPEARLDAGPYNALYAYGEAHAFGFSPFGIDSVSLPNPGSAKAEPEPAIAATYRALAGMSDLLLTAQAEDRTRGLVLHATSPRPTQTVALGGYLFEATLSRTWPARTLATDDGAMLILQSAPDEFYILGSGLTVSFYRDPDTDNGLAGIASIEEVTRAANGTWTVHERLNGDQSNQGRQLSLSAHEVHTYRVKLYTYSPTQPH